MKEITLFLSLLLFSLSIQAQQTVGLFTNTPSSFDGYTLFAPIKSTETYLIDNCGEKVHSWSSTYQPGLSCYLMDDGTLLRTGKIPGAGNGSGIIEMIDWSGNVIWDYSSSATHGKQHHDIELLPNGNILLLVWDQRQQSELTQTGSSTSNSSINSEQIIEVQPNLITGGATVIWEWKAWEHLVQNVDSTKDNYGHVGLSPEKIDINFLNHNSSDWLHFNGVSYNPEFDQIILSVHNFSEFWIIDHSTTTAEAASSSGGIFGQGGDLLYRWGNPIAYDQGTVNDQKLFLQHHTHWIADSLPGAGKIIVFNNQAGNLVGQNYSTVNMIDLPVDANGFYNYSGGAYLPTIFDWTYLAPIPTDFFSNIISGVQRLENGNTLICQGVGGRFFEVDSVGNTVWEYICPVNDVGPIVQNTTATNNNVFRAVRYPRTHSGFIGKALTPLGYIETGSTFGCSLYTGLEELPNTTFTGWELSPNPTSSYFNLRTNLAFNDNLNLEIFNSNGQLVHSQILRASSNSWKIDVEPFNTGVYFIQTSNKEGFWTDKLIINK